jgi:hypothetical protein
MICSGPERVKEEEGAQHTYLIFSSSRPMRKALPAFLPFEILPAAALAAASPPWSPTHPSPLPEARPCHGLHMRVLRDQVCEDGQPAGIRTRVELWHVARCGGGCNSLHLMSQLVWKPYTFRPKIFAHLDFYILHLTIRLIQNFCENVKTFMIYLKYISW